MKRKEIKVALAGNPNVGKSTLFNILTGLRQHVGNWPGKTVERKEGFLEFNGVTLRIIDLPGTYSLTAYSEEEKIARDFIIHEQPDVVINIVDASNLERNLYLTLQLLELTSNVVIALNMIDVAKAKGIEINTSLLSEILGVPVVETIASKSIGVRELIHKVVDLGFGKIKTKRFKADFGHHIEQEIAEIESLLEDINTETYPKRWLAIKLLEHDQEVIKLVRKFPNSQLIFEKLEHVRKTEIHHDYEVEIADKRYEIIDKITKKVIKRKKIRGESLTDKIDNIVTHKIFGIPILLAIYGFVFFATFQLSSPIVDFFDNFFSWLSEFIKNFLLSIKAPEIVIDMIVDGAIAGFSTVMTFVPLIAIFFFIYSILEDIGYMTRAAFVMDRVMHSLGLHGRTFLCLICAFGCNVPAILGTRTLANKKDKIVAILINPLIPCGARLGVMVFITGIFFHGLEATLVMLSLLTISICLAGVMGFFFKRFLLAGEHTPFVMEMPPYHIPNLRSVLLHTWERVSVFIKRASTLIVLFSIMMWFLSNFPSSENIEDTFAAYLGKILEPVGKLMGFDWKVTTALFFALLAKELSISTLAVIYGLESEGSLAKLLPEVWTPLQAYTFLLVHMIYVPCIATIAVIKKETDSWKWAFFAVGYSIFLAGLLGIIVYNLGSLFL
ncbi:MAG: ferrous iron transport protein B [Candidatus Altiarchaeales archaeon]|nr:MAG: ferrous iron transport protein B [Candidatus Altiarchaeales archaeon]